MDQTKFKDAHGVDIWVQGPYCCKYFTHREKLLIHAVLLNGVSFGVNDSSVNLIRKNMKEGNKLLDISGVFGYAEVIEERIPFLPRSVILLYL